VHQTFDQNIVILTAAILLPRNGTRQIIHMHTYSSVTKQYNLELVKGQHALYTVYSSGLAVLYLSHSK